MSTEPTATVAASASVAAPAGTAQLVADAKSAGNALLTEAKAAGEAFVTALGNTAEGATPTLVSDGEKMLLEFVPAFIRPTAEALAARSVNEIDAAAITLVKTGLGVALTRIAALG